MTRIFVWDGAMRLFHWLLVAGFLVAYFTPERAMMIHTISGYLVLSLLAVRIVYGFAGSAHARFSDFLPRPRDVWAHTRGLVKGTPQHSAGHNPTSALGAWALLVLILATVLTGALPIKAIRPLHSVFADLTIAMAVLHVIGVIVEDALTGEGLVASMVHGFKTFPEGVANKMRASGSTRRGLVAGALALAVAAIAVGVGTGTLSWPPGKEKHQEEHKESALPAGYLEELPVGQV
ncbi:MAG: cytochrome b/b6 domain-containing protein [Rhodovibrio sp.]|nr:cytochrome b/b6 domain-containing protein [Rhodovibrio sp.]